MNRFENLLYIYLEQGVIDLFVRDYNRINAGLRLRCFWIEKKSSIEKLRFRRLVKPN